MLVLIPILAMLALEFIVSGKRKLSAKALLLVFGGGLVLFLGVRVVTPLAWIYPEGEAVTRAQGQVAHLLSVKDWQKKPVIILEGSSATAFGINGEDLEKLLEEKGVPATVLQFSLSGANHFERLFMLKLFFEELGAGRYEELKKAPVLLLSEVFDSYDEHPLYLWTKEAYSIRAITWAYPSNALAAWRAAQASGKRDAALWPFLEHLLLNRFAVGLFSSMQPLNYSKKISGFFPLSGTKKTFHYEEAQKAFEEAIISPAATSPFFIPGWASYYKELQQQVGGKIDAIGFYALPTLEPQRRAYQEAFAHNLPPHTTMLGPASPLVMKTLLQEKFWFDGVHPQGPGSVLFTQWLADEIIKNWSQLLAMPWHE